MNRVVVFGSEDRKTAAFLSRIGRRLLKLLKKENVSLEISLLSDAEMRAIKKEFLPRNTGPANVLAFGEPEQFPHPESPRRPIGVIYLNREMHRGDPPRLAALLIHGLLHLLGYVHGKKGDILRMEKLEQKLWHRISSSV